MLILPFFFTPFVHYLKNLITFVPLSDTTDITTSKITQKTLYMAIYSKKDFGKVFWASNEGLKAGRDPLGIENSSVATYGKLLPGLTNQTKRIRYYSFFCWLLNEYDYEGKQRFRTHQQNFVRRAELAQAIILKDKEQNAIPGSLYVVNGNLKERKPGVYDLVAGADYTPEVNYWTYPQGALGQYYLGSLYSLQLLHTEQGRYYVYPRGKELAEQFRKSTDEMARTRLLESIENGLLDEDDIDCLDSISIRALKIHSPEWKMLNEILTSEDYDGSTLRRDTMVLFLKAIKEGIPIRQFPEYQYRNVGQSDSQSAAFGWYFFYLLEAFHYSIESIFWFALENANILNYQPMEVFISSCEETILAELKKTGIADMSIRDIVRVVSEPIPDLLNKLESSYKAKDYESASAQAICLICRIYNEISPNLSKIKAFESANDLARQSGILSKMIHAYVEVHLNKIIPDYIHSILLQIMNDHTTAACRKMGNGQSDLRKYMVEEGCIVHVETRYPQFTSPRTDSLYSFLRDMNYIDSNNLLTDIAEYFLKEYGEE